jgi:hypothetical protein
VARYVITATVTVAGGGYTQPARTVVSGQVPERFTSAADDGASLHARNMGRPGPA